MVTGRDPAAYAAIRSRPPALAPYIAAVGVAQQVVGQQSSRRVHGETDARGDDQLLAGDRHRLLHRAADALTDEGRVDAVVQHDDELVATEPASRPPSGNRRGEPLGHLLQHPIAHRMAEAVVDHLEVVEVDEQHGDLAGRGGGEQPVEQADERRTIGEIGQVVVRRRVGEALCRSTLVGDVFDVGDGQRDAVVLGHRHPGARPDELAVAAQVALIEQIRLGDAELEARPLRRRRPKVFRMGDLTDADAEQRLDRSLQHVGERLVGVDDPAVVQTDQRHAGRSGVERLLEPSARLLQRDRTPLAIAHVAQDHDERTIGQRRPVQRRLHQVRPPATSISSNTER